MSNSPAVPVYFSQPLALLRWHRKGRPWANGDLRIDGFTQGMAQPRWYSAIHLPTGYVLQVAGGVPNRDVLVRLLKEGLDQRADEAVARDKQRNRPAVPDRG